MGGEGDDVILWAWIRGGGNRQHPDLPQLCDPPPPHRAVADPDGTRRRGHPRGRGGGREVGAPPQKKWGFNGCSPQKRGPFGPVPPPKYGIPMGAVLPPNKGGGGLGGGGPILGGGGTMTSQTPPHFAPPPPRQEEPERRMGPSGRC